MEAWRAVMDAHATLTGSLEEALREADLPPLSWFHLLWTLDKAPDKRLRMSELAVLLSLSRGGLTKLVDRLEGAGLVTRASCSSDRRGYHVVQEPSGSDMLAKMWPVYEAELERHLMASLSDEEAETIRAALTRAARSACELDEAAGAQEPPAEAAA
jgi:DNA-binding MarR family transcriptional regulator